MSGVDSGAGGGAGPPHQMEGRSVRVMVWHLPGPGRKRKGGRLLLGWPNNMARVASSRTEMGPGSQRLTLLEATSRKSRGKNNTKKRILISQRQKRARSKSVSSLHLRLHRARKYLQASSESSLASGRAMEASNFQGALPNQDI